MELSHAYSMINYAYLLAAMEMVSQRDVTTVVMPVSYIVHTQSGDIIILMWANGITYILNCNHCLY